MDSAKESRVFSFPYRGFYRADMAKSPPEKLAAALRANLKRRKLTPVGPKALETRPGAKDTPAELPPGGAPQNSTKPPKNSA